jgi:hypothetical protein
MTIFAGYSTLSCCISGIKSWWRPVEREAENSESKAALPSGETFSDSPASMDLQSGKENLQK